MTSRVLVTGASGFIGRAMVPALQQAGFSVRTATRIPARFADAEAAILPAHDAPPEEFDALLSGVDHVVHLAGIAHAGNQYASRAYHEANTLLPQSLALAAARCIPGTFILMSSVRAQCGATHDGIVRETDQPEPQDDYGRSKLAAEQAVSRILGNAKKRFAILRPVLVYGPWVGGNLRLLIKLAQLPVPLPFASLRARRSIVDRNALCEAVLHCIANRATDGQTFLVADRTPLTVADILTAARAGFGRAPWLVPFPLSLMELGARLTGQNQRFNAVTGELIVDASRLEASGWNPASDSAERLAKAVRDEQVLMVRA